MKNKTRITIEHNVTPCGSIPASLITGEVRSTLDALNHFEVHFERDQDGYPFFMDAENGKITLVANSHLSADECDFSDWVVETYEKELATLTREKSRILALIG